MNIKYNLWQNYSIKKIIKFNLLKQFHKKAKKSFYEKSYFIKNKNKKRNKTGFNFYLLHLQR